MIKAYTNQRMAQRIICRRVERRGTDNKLTVEFVAKINKSKYNIALEGKEVVFGKIESGKFEWDTSKIFEGF